MPFVFRLFAAEDPAHDWAAFVGESYRVYAETAGGDGLPPDWVGYDVEAGAWAPLPQAGEHYDAFGYEAFRIAWSLAAELIWFEDDRARAALARLAPLATRFERDGALPAVILPDGGAGRPYPSLGMYGALLPAWGKTHPDVARALYEEVISPTRSASGWGDAEDYYAQNWVWFGVALFAPPSDAAWLAAIRPEETP
jgi:endo-1,4-beta-D-glucanase Y